MTLDRLTVLVGPNACGKSSVLQAMHLLCQMRDRLPREIVGSETAIQEMTTRDATTPMLLRAEGASFAIEWCANQVSQGHYTLDGSPWLLCNMEGEPRKYPGFWNHQPHPIEDREVLPRAELFASSSTTCPPPP